MAEREEEREQNRKREKEKGGRIVPPQILNEQHFC